MTQVDTPAQMDWEHGTPMMVGPWNAAVRLVSSSA